jgi:hypothetical protein
MFTAARASI